MRGTAHQGRIAIRCARLSCHAFRHNAVRLQLHALAYDPANSLRTLALPQEVAHRSLATLREMLVKIGARIVLSRWRDPTRAAAPAYGNFGLSVNCFTSGDRKLR